MAIKVLFISYFVSNPGSESASESELIRKPEWQSESEQSHHDSAPLVYTNNTRILAGGGQY